MFLSSEGLRNTAQWEDKGYRLYGYDREVMVRRTVSDPVWVHFGGGNLFKAFQADVCQRLLDAGEMQTGIVVADRRKRHSEENDNLFVKVTLRPDGSLEKAVVASIAEKLYIFDGDAERLKDIFENPSLQMVSFTITEKGYLLVGGKGEYLPEVVLDFAADPGKAVSYWGKITSFLYARYQKNGQPIAMVSMDNCSRNGDRIRDVVRTFAEAWGDRGFCDWLNRSVSFPWTMIDKITPGPDPVIGSLIAEDGLSSRTPFVNAEESEYLVIEDDFPNGRPPLEKAGIYLTDRETVDRAEHMKVCTCLNPLHTSLAIFGCLLGYDKLWKEMQDEDLRGLVQMIGYVEGLPAVTDPGIIHPREFLDEVINERFPNSFLPDTPWRIATDTSQKLAIRFGETIKAYMRAEDMDAGSLKLIPLVFAAWLRYLMAVDDLGNAFEPSPDPLLEVVRPCVSGYRFGEISDFSALEGLLSNNAVFGVDLQEAGLDKKVCSYFAELCSGLGAVRKTLHKYVQGSMQ